MFGKNIVLKQERSESGSLAVHSVFYTLQGEGPYAGRNAVFVRLYGCSLACSWCDTEFELHNQQFEVDDLLVWVASVSPPTLSKKPLIVLTGGEPLRQDVAPFLSAAVAREGYDAQVETAGIHWSQGLSDLRFRAPWSFSVVCSPKTPKISEEVERHACAFKYIVSAREELDEEDGLPKYAVSQKGQPNKGRMFRPLNMNPSRIYVQARDDIDPAKNKENLELAALLAMKYGYRLSIQQHKLLGLP